VVATPAINPEALLTQAVAVVETVAPSPTRLPFGLLNTINDRTAQWPIPWYVVLLIIVVVAAILIWLLRRGSRRRED
jgi:membrane protein implicated in regulation of membrane protease activity